MSGEKPKCPKCQEFDAETRRMMGALFGPHELALCVLNLAGYYKSLLLEKNKISSQISNPKRLMIQQQIDMTARTIGKFFQGMPDDVAENTRSAAEKRVGVILNVRHEACPGHPQGDNSVEQAVAEVPNVGVL